MTIVLARPSYNTHLITPPLGLGYLASFLKSNGFSARILDGLNYELDNKVLAQKCKGADLVGVSILSSYFLEAVDLIKELKKNGLLVAVGGPHVSALPKLTLEESGADFAVIGEGELTFLELAQKLAKGEEIEGISGLMTRGSTKFIRRELIADLTALPFPDWEQIDPRNYKKAPHGGLVKNIPVAPIMTTRGCPFECKFCASPFLWERKIRFRTPENVIEEIKLLVNQFEVKEIHFEDDNLTFRRDHIERICQLIIEEGIKIAWATPNGIRVGTVTGELLDLMKRSGCYSVTFGIESGSQEILDNIKKHTDLRTIKKAALLAKEKGLLTQGFFIFGLPGETKETIVKTVNFAKELKLDRAQFLLLDIIPGSALWRELDFADKYQWGIDSFREICWVPPTIDKKTLSSSQRKAFRSFYLRPYQIFSIMKDFKLSQLRPVWKRILDYKLLKP